jgi:hypothetical protein
VRAIGRWSLAALVVDSSIGSGILARPPMSRMSSVKRDRGRSYWRGQTAGVVIMACFAEVAAQFAQAGGIICILACFRSFGWDRSGLDALAGAPRRTGGYLRLVS